MLTADCLLAWFQRLNLPEQGRSTISHIRSAALRAVLEAESRTWPAAIPAERWA